MATSNEHQTIQAFPCYNKRKLDSHEASVSLVYENSVFAPRSEKRQRLSGHYNENQTNSLDENTFSVNPNAEDQFTGFSESEQNMEEDSEMVEEMAYKNTMAEVSAQTMNEEANTNSVQSESRTEITKSVNCHVNLPRTRALNCTTPSVHSFCFQGGLLDNMLVSYHGL